MTKQTASYTIEPFPAARQIIVEAGRLGSRRPLIHGLLEIDVTRARTVLREHKARTGEALWHRSHARRENKNLSIGTARSRGSMESWTAPSYRSTVKITGPAG